MIDLLYKRRSIRIFKQKQLPLEFREKILKAALLAPSSKSRRPWEFIAIDDQTVIKQIAECKPKGAAFIKNAPWIVVVAADAQKCDVWIEDCSIASILMQIEAETLGLGSCWVQVRERPVTGSNESEEYIKELLEIPAHFRVESVIAFGFPDEQKEPYSDSDLDYSKIHSNVF